MMAPAFLSALLLFALSACSSSSKTTTPTTTSGGAGATSATTGATSSATGSPFVIGFQCSCSGAFASSTAIQENIIKAWVTYENSHGGINGHPVKLIFNDDSLNPSTSLSQVTTMVQQDHVIAIIDGTDIDSAWAKFVSQKGIPVVGDNLANSTMYSDADFFPEGQTINTLPASIAAAAKKDGITSLGSVYCSSDPVCAELAKPIAQAAQAVGVKAPYAAGIPETAPNYTAQCIDARSHGVNGMFVAESITVVEHFVNDCTAQGYKPKYLAEDGAVGKSFLTTPGLDGMLGIENNLPAEDTSNPAVQTMISAVDKAYPGLTNSPNWGPAATGVWASGMLFAAAAKAANLGDNATPAQVKQGLYALHGETLGGLAPPLTYTPGKPTTVDCWFYLGVHNKQFTTPYGSQPYCGSSA
ncbi:MAG: ABC transporter substrate-binding protein [Acidimicrobiaceae bacterium]|nr:ABC transporter substrate-binding protein [Acidimicrobiaceae bacterium]